MSEECTVIVRNLNGSIKLVRSKREENAEKLRETLSKSAGTEEFRTSESFVVLELKICLYYKLQIWGRNRMHSTRGL